MADWQRELDGHRRPSHSHDVPAVYQELNQNERTQPGGEQCGTS
jgi:hypothetical protein